MQGKDRGKAMAFLYSRLAYHTATMHRLFDPSEMEKYYGVLCGITSFEAVSLQPLGATILPEEN